MEKYNVAELKPESVFASDLILDKGFLIIPAHCPILQTTIDALKEWNFAEISSLGGNVAVNGVPKETQASESPNNTEKTENAKKSATDAQESVEALLGSSKKKSISAQLEDVTSLVKNETAKVNPRIQEAFDRARDKHKENNDEKTEFSLAEGIYNEYLRYIDSVFTRYATHKDFNIAEISETVKQLCVFVKDWSRYILRITPTQEEHSKRYLVYHSMRTTVLAISIGLQLNMVMPKLVELGVATLLHEIGMLKLPPQIYMSTKPLSSAEKTQLFTHPILSYNILKESNFPLTVQLGVLDHHERENGTGYPRKSVGSNISLYGKIIAVACSFEAITTPRMFKEARSTYEGMVELLRNDNHQYDDTVIKGLLYSLSLYPLGAYLLLANGKIAQVVDVDPSDPKNPIVQMVGKDASANGEKVSTSDYQIKIVRVMSKKEAEEELSKVESA